MKKIVAIIVAIVIVLSVGGFSAVTAFKSYSDEKTLKADREVALISDLFHDQAYVYITPDEPTVRDNITIRLRTEKYNVTMAQVQYFTDSKWHTVDMQYWKKDKSGYYDYFEGVIPAQKNKFYYRFIVGNKGGNIMFYDLSGINVKEPEGTSDAWCVMPGFSTPDWSKGALWYSIMPDAFYNGDTTNDDSLSGEFDSVSWNTVHKGQTDRYGGDFAGLLKKIDYISELGVDAVYMNPVAKSNQNAGYSSIDFNQIEPNFGNAASYKKIVEQMHKKDIKVMMDVVLTVNDLDSIYFNKNGIYPETGAFLNENSEYKSWFPFYTWPDVFHKSWDGALLNLNSDSIKSFIYTKPDSYLQRCLKEYGVDSFRFDCGGWLYSNDDSGLTSTNDIILDIRSYLKKTNKDCMLLSESDGNNMTNYGWDSQWNPTLMDKLQGYASGLIPESVLNEIFYKAIRNLPRPVALCIVNQLCTHDAQRIDVEDEYMKNSAILLYMNYVGSPSIYYGDEVGLIREKEQGIGISHSFYAMQWNENEWNFETRNLYKGLSELRKKYSAVKTGAIKDLEVSVDDNLFAYGRFDENGTVVTVASQNDQSVDVDIDARSLSVKDGTVFTDWFTGETYKVVDGTFTAHIIPGGSVIVSGKQASSYRSQFSVNKIKNSNVDVIQTDKSEFYFSGSGNISSKTDKITFLNKQQSGAFSLSSALTAYGKQLLMIRADDSAESRYYGLVYDGDSISVMVRNKFGERARQITKKRVGTDVAVKIIRQADNTLASYCAVYQENGKLGTYEKIENSEFNLSFDNSVLCGMAILKGEGYFSNVELTSVNQQVLCEAFDNDSVGALFNGLATAKDLTVKNGYLQIKTGKSNSEYTSFAPEKDWTYKAKIAALPNDNSYAGIVSRQDNDNAVLIVRKKQKGKERIVFEKQIRGVFVEMGAVQISNKKDVIIQLQKMGCYFTAVYSFDGYTWSTVGDKEFINLGVLHNGILLSKKCVAKFDYVCYGDSINDGVSISSPCWPAKIYTTFDKNYYNSLTEKYEYLNGDWYYKNEGYYQASKEGFAALCVVDKEYDDVRLQATFTVENVNGYAGLAFGRKNSDDSADSGYTVRLSGKGDVSLWYGDKQLGSYNSDITQDVRLTVECVNGRITVYGFDESIPIISVNDIYCEGGYAAYITNNTSAYIKNFGITGLNSSWNNISGSVSGFSTLITCNSGDGNTETYGMSSVLGYGLSDFIATVSVEISDRFGTSVPRAGLILSASESEALGYDGISITYNHDGFLEMSENNTVIKSAKLDNEGKKTTFMVVKQGGTYKVYVRGLNSPVLEYTESQHRGGVISIVSVNSYSVFKNLLIENLGEKTDPSVCELYQKFINNNLGSDVNYAICKENFDNEISMNKWLISTDGDSGKWRVKDGCLESYDSMGWQSRVSYAVGVYNNFTMSFKLKTEKRQDGWIAVSLYRKNPREGHEESGVSLLIDTVGSCAFYDAYDRKEYMRTDFDFSIGEWQDFKIVCKDSLISVYKGNNFISSYRTSWNEGFVGFAAGKANFSIDNVEIIPSTN